QDADLRHQQHGLPGGGGRVPRGEAEAVGLDSAEAAGGAEAPGLAHLRRRGDGRELHELRAAGARGEGGAARGGRYGGDLPAGGEAAPGLPQRHELGASAPRRAGGCLVPADDAVADAAAGHLQ
ncbi:unnamed protein product, partial [Effrenium voratum]